MQTVFSKGVTVDPSDIENTDDWLGNPEPLETCRHQLRMYENEFESLSLQLARALENVEGLVRMNDEITRERDSLRELLATTKNDLSDAKRRANQIETSSNWELMAKGKHICELNTQIRILKGENPFAPAFPHQRDTS